MLLTTASLNYVSTAQKSQVQLTQIVQLVNFKIIFLDLSMIHSNDVFY